nr:serine/threonine-protein kinase CLA4 isoform X2 [Drosophila kikkawai]
MAKNLENSLIEAFSKYVSIDEHRPEYTAHYDALRKEIYSQWRGHETVGKLVNGYTLGGGYGDKVKVGMPDEFDLVIHLQFPENDKIIVTADRSKPGNVILDMSKVMQILANQEHNKAVFQLLQKIVNHKQQLLEDKLQSLLQGLMTQALIKMGNQIEVNGVVSLLKYKRCGPAHTIEVKGRYVYSVDFVPAIKLAPAQSVLAPEQRQHFGQTPSWDAVPKPIKPPRPDNPSFRASYYEAEKKLIYGKNNLKNAIRMLKQHRNTKSNMSNLKSYFIKTLFLWEVVRQDASYWNRSSFQMLTKLADVLSLSSAKGKGKLLFFWDPKLDMIADLDTNQRKDLFNCVIGAQSDFRRADGNLTDDIKNRVKNSFSNGDKEKEKLENKPSNGQVINSVKEKSPPVVKPNPTPNEPKKKAAAQTENKPKVKAEPVQVKPNPKPNVEVQTGAKTKVKAEPIQVKPNPKPNVEVQTGAKTKVKAEPVQVKPNPKPNEQQKSVKPNPNQNQPKAAKGETPPPVQPNQPKKAEPETKTNPNGNATKAKANIPNPQPQPQPQPKAKANTQTNSQPQPKTKANVPPNSQPQPKANPNQNSATKPQTEASPKKEESSCRIN